MNARPASVRWNTSEDDSGAGGHFRDFIGLRGGNAWRRVSCVCGSSSKDGDCCWRTYALACSVKAGGPGRVELVVVSSGGV